ncbi:hypothetical protein QAD02_014340 [Eretmocerus hayati]|uniref:Uncharacterized protein n=1 Tax=Eretmocerus hayati TaxID=131215 RepID=A0ACC2P612_9HYME|nr:hypothetical protein QAD02_014340 [Eretmocerus hayati]
MGPELNPMPIRKRKSKNNWTTIIKNQATDFCLATGLHGYKYIVQNNRTKTERFVWAGIVVISFICSLTLMRIAYRYNTAHSTLTVIKSTHHGIWNYHYPAVTICNNNQISSRKVRDFVKNLELLGGLSREFVLKEMRLLVELLDPGVFENEIHTNLTILQDIFDANNHSVLGVMKMIQPDCTRLLKSCKWKGNSTPCHELFEESYSRDGLCCSFNYLSSETRINKNNEPRRLTACGYQTGLTILVDPEPNDYYSSLFGSYGVKVMLHHPHNYPDRSTEFKYVGMGVQVFLGMSPEDTQSTPGVRGLPLKVRDCVFDNEKLPKTLQSLQSNFTWTRYSYTNCLNACRASTILYKCGCIPYYMAQNAAYDTSWPGIEINSVDLTHSSIDLSNRPCGCLLDCTLARYPVDSTTGILSMSKFDDDQLFWRKVVENKNTSLINVFFTDLVSIQYRRDVYYNWKNLFASFGGLLGLFVGFSIMSGFELVYFFVVRVITDRCIEERDRLSVTSFH